MAHQHNKQFRGLRWVDHNKEGKETLQERPLLWWQKMLLVVIAVSVLMGVTIFVLNLLGYKR